MNKYLSTAALLSLLTSCTPIDNYILGKDNTPKPASLAAIASKANMGLKWSVPVGKAKKSNADLKLQPVIQGKIIYTADSNGTVQATNKNTGKMVWSKQLKQGIVSGPAVGDGYLAVGTSASQVALLKQTDGQLVWKSRVSSDALSKPAIANQKVIAKTIDGNLFAFDLVTGKKIWVVDHGAPSLILKAGSSPAVMGNTVLVGFSDGKLDAVDMNLGHVMWQRSIAYASGSSDVESLVGIDADPIVRSGVVYLATYQGYIGAFSLENGQFIWNKPASTYKNMAIDDSALYYTDSHDVLWSLDRQTGQVKWKQSALKARGLSEPVLLNNNQLVVGDKTGYLHLISTQTGEQLARTQLSGAIDIAPNVSGRNIYVMTANGKLNCISVS